MAVDPLGKLLSLRKVRVENAISDLTALTNEKASTEQRLAATRLQFQSLMDLHGAVLQHLQTADERTLSQIAAVQGDLMGVRVALQETQGQIVAIEEEIAQLENRIVAARSRWKELERARDRCDELRSELKKRGLFEALAAEEYAEG
jgi:chromosome segregation ATPase